MFHLLKQKIERRTQLFAARHTPLGGRVDLNRRNLIRANVPAPARPQVADCVIEFFDMSSCPYVCGNHIKGDYRGQCTQPVGQIPQAQTDTESQLC